MVGPAPAGVLLYARHPAAGSRLIGGYVVRYAIGAIAWPYTVAGWGAVCALGAAFSRLGFAL